MMLIIIFATPHHIPSSLHRHDPDQLYQQSTLAERNLNNCLGTGASECTSGSELQGFCHQPLLSSSSFVQSLSPPSQRSSFTTTIVITRSSNNIWSWLPNLPNSGRLPRAEAGLLEVVVSVLLKSLNHHKTNHHNNQNHHNQNH